MWVWSYVCLNIILFYSVSQVAMIKGNWVMETPNAWRPLNWLRALQIIRLLLQPVDAIIHSHSQVGWALTLSGTVVIYNPSILFCLIKEIVVSVCWFSHFLFVFLVHVYTQSLYVYVSLPLFVSLVHICTRRHAHQIVFRKITTTKGLYFYIWAYTLYQNVVTGDSHMILAPCFSIQLTVEGKKSPIFASICASTNLLSSFKRQTRGVI